MFQIRAEHFAALRRKKIGDALISGVAPFEIEGRWNEQKDTLLLDDPLGQRSQVGFDGFGFIDRFTSPLGRTWKFTNIADGKPVQLASPSGHMVGMAYDEAGRLSQIGSTTKQWMQMYYTPQSQPAGAAYADGTQEFVEYTPWSAPARATDRLGAQTSLHYDKLKRLTALTDGNGHTTQFEYSRWDRPDATLFPNGTSESYTYDAEGRVSSIVQGDAMIVLMCNDKGRPLLLQYSDGTRIEYAYDGDGNITKAALGDLVTTIVWNQRGQVEEEITGDLSHKFFYDAAGRLTAIVSSAGETVGYSWDADSRLSGFTDWNGGVHTIEYEPGDRGVVTTNASGVRTFTGLEPGGKLENMNVTFAGKSLFSLACSYDADARLSTSRDSIFGDRAFGYDAEGRVVLADATSASSRESFAYDAAGNLTRINGVAATVDAANQLVALGGEELSYDSRGNLVRRNGRSGEWLFRYNARNQMIASISPGKVETTYAYDAFGRRILKRTEEKETHFTWAGELLVAEVSTDGGTSKAVRQSYLYNPENFAPLATCVDGKVYSYHVNHLRTPRVLTGPDGSVGWAADFETYGFAAVAVQQMRNPLRFAGQYFDDETGLHYNRFRYYSPELRRYTTRDPLGFAAGTNFYSYAACDPINQTDIFGLFGWKTLGVIAASVAVAALVIVFAPVAAPLAIILAGAAAGAVAGGLNEALSEKTLCWPCILKAAGLGALAGAVSSLPFLLLPEAAGIGLFALAGGTGGGIGYLVNCVDGVEKNPSLKGFAIAVGVGSATAGTMKTVTEGFSAQTEPVDEASGNQDVTGPVDDPAPVTGRQVIQVRSAEDVNTEMLADGKTPCWMPGTSVTTEIVPAGTRYQMVLSDGQANAVDEGVPAFGGFATPDEVPNQAFAQNEMAITTGPEGSGAFKTDVSRVVTVETTSPQMVNSGTVGPVGGLEGGANQVEFLGGRSLQAVNDSTPLPKE